LTTTTAAQLKASRDYKRRKRLSDPEFVAKEREYRATYRRKMRRLQKLAVRFIFAYHDQFKMYCRSIGVYI